MDTSRLLHRSTALALLAITALAGCSSSFDEKPGQSASSESASQLAAETWDVIYIQGGKVGYAHETEQDIDAQGQPQRRIDQELVMTAHREGVASQMAMKFSAWETPTGELIKFSNQSLTGPTLGRVSGQVEGSRLRIETEVAGKKQSDSIAWSPEFGGFRAVEQSLTRKPMQPGERRVLKHFMPLVNQVVTSELTARQLEPTSLLSGTAELLRIDQTMTLPGGNSISSVAWCDRAGQILKQSADALGQTTYRTTREVALAEGPEKKVDIFAASLVKLDKPINDAHRTSEVVYRVEVEAGDPTALFVSGPTQEVRALAKHTADVVVRAIRPGVGARSAQGPADPPTDGDRNPSTLIQSDDPRIVEMAREAASDESDPWRVAVKLETYVKRKVAIKDYTQAFASASDVARTLQGDCTEHAVLLAALLRARGLPSRVAMGLVYLNSQPGMLFHMWTEVYVDERWIPLDATLGLGGVGADRLKLGQSDLAGVDAFASFLPVAQAIGKLKITVQSVH
jgi:transglutaminase-like putative cysteine protease